MELADRNWESGLKCIHYGIKELILYEKDRNVASKLLSNTKNFIRNSKLYVNHIRNMKSGLDHAEQIRSFIGEIEKIGIDMKQEFDEMQQDYEKQLDKIHNEYDSKLRYNGPTFKQSPEGRLKSLKELHETTMQMVTPKKYQMKAV
jgi:DNA anti-recombination protein RmuC